MGDGLVPALDRLAGLPRLLIALDFDGVLAPLVDEPSAARPLPESDRAVRTLAALPGVEVVMLSGRGRDDLAAVSGFGPPIRLVGSHGGEYDPELGAALGIGDLLTAEQAGRRRDLIDELQAMVDDAPGSRLELKPGGVAVHVRGVDSRVASALLDRVREGPARRDGVDATEGKDVIDLAVLQTSKGSAVDALRRHFGAGAVLFAGDDVTDETAFAVLNGDDVGIKVGEGDTKAQYRVASPAEMASVLTWLAASR